MLTKEFSEVYVYRKMIGIIIIVIIIMIMIIVIIIIISIIIMIIIIMLIIIIMNCSLFSIYTLMFARQYFI